VTSWEALTALLAVSILAGCASTPSPARVAQPTRDAEPVMPAAPLPPPSVTSQHQAYFENGLVLAYEIETKRSRIDGESCYSFISGTLENGSQETLAHRTAVRFQIFHQGKMLFEDYAYLRTQLSPGNRVQFDVVQSPLHLKQCPTYDKIDVALRKIALY
jgi:cold shock CspA family protein